MNKILWSSSYAYVSTDRCNCGLTNYKLATGDTLHIRPNGERNLQNDLNHQLRSAGLRVEGVLIAPKLHEWSIVLDITGQGDWVDRWAEVEAINEALDTIGITGVKRYDEVPRGENRYIFNLTLGL